MSRRETRWIHLSILRWKLYQVKNEENILSPKYPLRGNNVHPSYKMK